MIGFQQEPTGLDPTLDSTAAIETIVAQNIVETLVQMDERGQVKPALATGWTITADGLTYAFKIRDNRKFHNGRKLDSSDVKFSFERAMAPDSTNPNKRIFANIATVATPSPTEVVLTLKTPDSLLLFNLTNAKAGVWAKETVETNKVTPVGSGPYKFGRRVTGDRIVLVRNDDHPDAKSVRLREVSYKFIQDPNASVAALLSGDLDAFPNMPAPEMLKQFERNAQFKVAVGTTEGEVILAIHNGKAPFNDVRVRRAIAHAIDRKALIEGAMFGYGTPIGSHFPPHNPNYVDLTGMYPLDLAKAKALLAEAGHPNGFEASLKLPPFPYARRSGEVIASQLGAIGIKIKIEPVEWAQWIGPVFRESQFDLTIVAHVQPYDLDNYTKQPYYYNYNSPDFTKLWGEILQATDPAKQGELFKRAQRKVAEDAVNGFLFQLPQLGVYRAGLEGYWLSSPGAAAPLAQLRWTR
ncbi:MAG: ABC transporter substrate-binding protein [Alphaproteobacteria bacterium]|nr:ABC transporter substrate-binding protein [Alphaproteobacteria bacterium]